MIIRDGTAGDERFIDIELATYVSGNRLIVVVNETSVCVARLVLRPFDLGDGSAGVLRAIARHSLPETVTLGAADEEAHDVASDSTAP